MSFFQGKILLNLLIKLLNRPSINWSNFELCSSLQLSDFVDLLLEPINSSEYNYRIKLGLHEALINAVTHGQKLDPKSSKNHYSELVRLADSRSREWFRNKETSIQIT